MSHTTAIEGVVVTDIPALKKAVRQLQKEGVECELLQDATPRMYYPQQERDLANSPYVLKLKNAKYDVAFVKNDNGTFSPTTDLYGKSVTGQIGATCPMPNTPAGRAQHAIGNLMQKYAENAVLNAARKQGHNVQRVFTDKKGNRQIVLAVA